MEQTVSPDEHDAALLGHLGVRQVHGHPNTAQQAAHDARKQPLSFVAQKKYRAISTGVTRPVRALHFPETVDISAVGVVFFALALLLFLPFVLTSTFPVSVKWLLLCGQSALLALLLLALAGRKQAALAAGFRPPEEMDDET